MPQNVTDMFSYGNYTSHISLNPYSAAVTSVEGNLISAPASSSGGVLTCGDPITGPAPRFLPAGSFLPGGLNLIYGTDGAGAFVSYSQTGVGSAVVMASAPSILSPTLTGVVNLTGTLLMPGLPANSLLVTPSTPGSITAVVPGTGGVLISAGGIPSFSQSVGLTGGITAAGLHSSGVGEPVSRNDNAAAISAPGGGVSVAQTLWANNVKADTAVTAPTVNATTLLNTPDLTLASFADATNSIPYTLVTGNFQPMPIGAANTLLVSTGPNNNPTMSSTLAGLTLTAPSVASASFTGTLSGSASWSSAALSAESPALSGTVTGGATYNGVTLAAPVVTTLIADAAPATFLGRRTSDNRITETSIIPVASGGTGVTTSTGTGATVRNTDPVLTRPALAYPWKSTNLPAQQTTSFPANGFLGATIPDGTTEYWATTGSERVVMALTPTLSSPTLTGTVGGGATYSSTTLTSPTISGTVAGGATYTAPTLTTPALGVATATSLSMSGVGALTLGAIATNELLVSAVGGVIESLPIVGPNRILHSHGPGFDPGFRVLDLSGADTSLANLLPVVRGGTGSSTFPIISLTSGVSGVLPVANGGTGSATFPIISLTTGVSGVLPIASGGTGSATVAAGSLFVGPDYPGASGAPSFNTNPTVFALGIGSASGQSFRIDSVTDAANSLSASTTYAGGVAVAKTLWAKDVKCDTVGAWAVPYADAALNLKPAALGASGTALMSNGPSAVPSFRTPTIPNRIYYGSGAGTHTPTTGCIYFYVQMCGGGGVGGPAAALDGGSGGGAGGYTSFFVTNNGTVYNYQTGAASFGNGNASGFQRVASGTVTAFGGDAGATLSSGGPGGAVTTSGTSFYSSLFAFSGSNGNASITGHGGAGGVAVFGGGSGSVLNSNGTEGRWGSGGAGASIIGTVGGQGGAGVILITEYFF